MALSVESPTYKLWAYTMAANLAAGLVLCLILGAASQDLADGLLTFFVLFGCLLFIGIRAESKYATANLTVILLLAFVLRSFLAIASSLGRLVPALYTLDAEGYDMLGQLVVTGWQTGTPASHVLLSSLNVKVYAYLCAAVYYVLGHSPLTMKILNCFAGTLMVYNVFRITRKLHNGKTAMGAALLLAVFPSLIFWTSQNFRDALVFYLVSQILYESILWAERGGARWPVRLLLLSLPLFLLRVQIGALIVLCIAMMCAYYLVRSPRHLLKPVLYMALLGGLALLIYLSRGISALAVLWDVTPSTLSTMRETMAYHGTTNFSAIQYNSWLDVIKFSLYTAAYFLLSPFPWQLANPVQAMASIENLIFWGFLFCAVPGVRQLLRENSARVLFMILFIVLVSISFGLLEGNVGTAYRHKMQISPYLMMLGCIYLSKWHRLPARAGQAIGLSHFVDRWNLWRQQSVNRRIFGAMVVVGGFTLAVKLAMAANELVVAYQFGAGDALDAFLIAFLLPSFIINVVSGSFNSAFVPTYVQVREQEGPAGAQQLLSRVMAWNVALLLALSGLLALAASYVLPVLGSGFSPEKLALTRSLFFVLLPILILKGLATIWAAALNADERFALAAVAPIMAPIGTMVVLVLMSKVWGIYALASGTVAGFLLEAAVTAWGATRRKLSLLPRWRRMDPVTRQVMSQYAPMVAGSFMMSSTTLVDQSMAAMLGPGSVSALRYGYMAVAFIVGTGTVALGTAVLPHFSRMITMEDWTGIRHTLRSYARLILLLTVPATLLFVLFSEPMARLLFQRGAFTAADTRLVGRIQAFYFLQLPFYFLGILIVRLISSLKANHVLMWGALISLVVNVVFNYAFMRWLGVAGIALSTSVVYLVSFSYLLGMALRLLAKAGYTHG